jgi:hypothetical protein
LSPRPCRRARWLSCVVYRLYAGGVLCFLLDYLTGFCASQEIALPPRFIRVRLETGTAVVLLDGLDEVADPDLRRRVARMVEAFTVRCPANRYVITSRIVGYEGPACLADCPPPRAIAVRGAAGVDLPPSSHTIAPGRFRLHPRGSRCRPGAGLCGTPLPLKPSMNGTERDAGCLRATGRGRIDDQFPR